jgi:predicted Zn-dependent protease
MGQLKLSKKIPRLLSVLLITTLVLSACSTVAITGRKQFNIIPNSSLLSMSFSQYDQFLKENKISADHNNTATIKRIGKKIQGAVERYFVSKNMGSELSGYAWEFNLIESEQVNAWCMPGGKVVFYTGILPLCKDEAGIAVVMGHEVAHAIADHGGERMSQGIVADFGGMALDKLLEDKPDETRALAMTAFGIGAQLGVMLPFSRLHESEADHLGLIFMAMAGYDPNNAVEFWQRMAALKDGNTPVEFLSTHPSDQTRIDDIKKLIPVAMQYYKK